MANFAALEQRLSRAAVSQLSNASAVWLSGAMAGLQAAGGLRLVFDRPGALALEGLANDFNPTATVLQSAAADAARGDVLHITPDATGTALTMAIARVSPDGTGLLTLELREADL